MLAEDGRGVLRRLRTDRPRVGLDFDLRRDEPYLAYGALPDDVMRVVTRADGDCLAAFECLLDQVTVSLDVAGALRSASSTAARHPDR